MPHQECDAKSRVARLYTALSKKTAKAGQQCLKQLNPITLHPADKAKFKH